MATRLTLDQQRLASYVQAHLNSSRDLFGGLCEYVSCSIIQGKRVREWCAEIIAVLSLTPTSLAFRNALISPQFAVLLPYTHLPADPFFPAQPPLPLPLIPSLALSTISRKQLIETLATFSRQLDALTEPSFYTEELIIEICLEYICRRWREGWGDNDLIMEISRKLTEVEFELQLQGHPIIVKSTILPALHKVRFNLGLVTPSQLSNRLNGTSSVQTYQLIQIWLEQRLSACVEQLILIEELQLLKSKLSNQHRYILRDVLKHLGLYLLFALDKHDHFALTTPFNVIRRTRSTPFVTPKMGGKSIHAPKWFSHKRHSSSSSKVQIEKHHRSSLPTEPTTMLASEGTPPSRSTGGLASTHEEILSSLMAFSNPEDIQAILLSHLVALRYHAQGHDDGWFLGGGQVRAGELLDVLEKRMVGRKDVIGLKEVFEQLRQAFGSIATQDPATEFELSIENDPSSDLHQYLAATSMDMGNTSCPSLHSPSSLSVLTTDSQSQQTHSPRLSNYTIREAKVEYPHESRATACHLPLTPMRKIEPCSTSTPDLLQSRFTTLPPKVDTPHRSSHQTSDLATADATPSSNLTLSHSPPRQSLSSRTPDPRRLSATEKNRRAIRRNFAIFDGEPLTPSPRSSESVKRPNSIDSVLSADVWPKVPLRISSLKPLRRVSFSPDAYLTKAADFVEPSPPPVPLAHVIGLFNGIDTRADVTPGEVKLIVEEVVRAERQRIDSNGGQWDAEAKDKVVWLLEQVGEMLNDDRLIDIIDQIKKDLNNSNSTTSLIPPTPNLQVRYPRLDNDRPRSMESLLSQSSTYSTPSALDWPTTPSPSDSKARPTPQRRKSSNGTLGEGASAKKISIASIASIVLPD